MSLPTLDTRRVWIPNHPAHAYLPGKVEETLDDGTLLVVDEAGGQFRVPHSEAQSVDPACLAGVDDLLMLGDFNEAALLHNIRVRYNEDKIYTGIGSPILISVNPYQHIAGLYSPSKQKQYRHAGATGTSSQQGGPPVHLYTVADKAYKTMLNEQVNQSIIISGESGAGKTEATKHILVYFAEMQRNKYVAGLTSDGSPKQTVEQQVLDANPVLEAFGNAKTVRNDNSSRFGKFVEVEFDASGRLLSAQVSNYLLEKCRIVTQQPEERNYHVFYQLCAGSAVNARLPEGLQLTAASDFEYARTCTSIPKVDDASDFSEIVERMRNLGFTNEDCDAVFQIVAAILHLGNLTFTPCTRDGQDRVTITDTAKATLICDLLGLEIQQFHSVLEHKTLEDPLTKKTIHLPHDLHSASYARHSMAKVAYARLFDWLVWRINESISGHGKARKDLRRIGILDIYGFEVFEWNSFEQLCINFANEKLQQHFNTHMFTLEQRLYTSEGITWSHITWQDNQNIIDSLEKKPLGLFCLVDSECLMMPSTTDNTLLGKIYNTFKNSKIICKPSRFACTDFSVAHYAGEVIYSVETFLEKNTDKLHGDIVNLFKVSKLELLKTLFVDPRFAPELTQKSNAEMGRGADKLRSQARRKSALENDQRRERQNVTVSMMFREQLDKLVEDLNRTNPRYVRCIKPNGNKQTHQFDSVDVLRQLRCAGMLESIRIRRAGYAVRRPFKEFFSRFRTLAPQLVAIGADPDYRSLCQRLATEVEQRLRREDATLDGKLWQMGQTRVFMKEELERNFERLLVEDTKAHVLMLQKRWRGYSQKKTYRMLHGLALEFQKTLRARQAMAVYIDAKKCRDATLTLQAAFRSFRACSEFARQRHASICIQRFARGRQCRSRIGRLKNKVAAEKIRRFREEDDQRVALQAARLEAQEKERAMLEMQRQLEKVQRCQNEKIGQDDINVHKSQDAAAEIKKLQDENNRLLENLTCADAKNKELLQQTAHLRHENESLQEDVRKAIIDKEHLHAGMAKSSNNALDSLRSEILSRIGESSSGQLCSDLHPLGSALSPTMKTTSGTTLASALRPAGSAMSPIAPLMDLANSEDSGRNTLTCQREVFEKLKQQFQVAQGSAAKTEDQHGDNVTAEMTLNIQQLEDVVRRLQLENANLKTNALSAQEETIERVDESAKLLQQVSRLQAEIEDLKYQHKGEVSAFRQQLEETSTIFKQQTEDMVRLNSRSQGAEQRATSFQSQMQRLSQLEAGWTDLEKQLSIEQKERKDAQSRVEAAVDELDTMRRERRAKENELANIKRVLDDVMSVHAPVEEVQKWKTRAEKSEQQYHQAMLYNREMSSAVGHMTHAASERGRDWSDLQERNIVLRREQERKDQEIKTAELEKQDLQKQLDSLQSSCSYFQKKYNDLKHAQKEHSVANEHLSKTQLECENLRTQTNLLRQQFAEIQRMEQDHCKKLQVVNECLNTLSAAHSEQIHFYEQAVGHIPNSELQRRHDKVNNVIIRMKSLIGNTAEAGVNACGELEGSHIGMDATQQHLQGRTSLLTQLNCTQRPGLTALPAKAAWHR